MNFILFDDASRNNLLPLVFTRPVADIRVGILTIREKWEKLLNAKTFSLTEEYLSEKFPLEIKDNNILINSSIIPDKILVEEVKQLKPNQILKYSDYVIAYHITGDDFNSINEETQAVFEEIESKAKPVKLNYTWEIFTINASEIEKDFRLITENRKSAEISDSNRIIGKENVFVEEGAKIECAIINATEGPVYIAKDAEIMEGSVIRGPFALGEHSVVKMSAKIYGATTVGPYSKVGGELNNVVILGYSNKAHDGFLGNSVIGEWCNLGADTNTSNLKNTYEEVKLWNYPLETFLSTGLQFCGLIMGDHSKCGINTMFNTGTVVGVNANIFGAGFQRNFIPSFSWGAVSGTTYDLKRAIKVAKTMYNRRNMQFEEIEQNILTHVFNLTHKNRML